MCWTNQTENEEGGRGGVHHLNHTFPPYRQSPAFKVKDDGFTRSLLFFVPYFPTRLDFPSPPLSAPGSPRMS